MLIINFRLLEEHISHVRLTCNHTVFYFPPLLCILRPEVSHQNDQQIITEVFQVHISSSFNSRCGTFPLRSKSK